MSLEFDTEPVTQRSELDPIQHLSSSGGTGWKFIPPSIQQNGDSAPTKGDVGDVLRVAGVRDGRDMGSVAGSQGVGAFAHMHVEGEGVDDCMEVEENGKDRKEHAA